MGEDGVSSVASARELGRLPQPYFLYGEDNPILSQFRPSLGDGSPGRRCRVRIRSAAERSPSRVTQCVTLSSRRSRKWLPRPPCSPPNSNPSNTPRGRGGPSSAHGLTRSSRRAPRRAPPRPRSRPRSESEHRRRRERRGDRENHGSETAQPAKRPAMRPRSAKARLAGLGRFIRGGTRGRVL